MSRERDRKPVLPKPAPAEVSEEATPSEHVPVQAGQGGRYVLDQDGNRTRAKE